MEYSIIKTENTQNPWQNLYYNKDKKMFCFDIWNLLSPNFNELSGHVTVYFTLDSFKVYKFGDFQNLTSYKELENKILLNLNEYEINYICQHINHYLQLDDCQFQFYVTDNR